MDEHTSWYPGCKWGLPNGCFRDGLCLHRMNSSPACQRVETAEDACQRLAESDEALAPSSNGAVEITGVGKRGLHHDDDERPSDGKNPSEEGQKFA